MSASAEDAMWAAQLEGHPVDLEWAEKASVNLEFRVARHEDGMWLLTSPEFANFNDAAAVRDYAKELVVVVNGAGSPETARRNRTVPSAHPCWV